MSEKEFGLLNNSNSICFCASDYTSIYSLVYILNFKMENKKFKYSEYYSNYFNSLRLLSLKQSITEIHVFKKITNKRKIIVNLQVTIQNITLHGPFTMVSSFHNE